MRKKFKESSGGKIPFPTKMSNTRSFMNSDNAEVIYLHIILYPAVEMFSDHAFLRSGAKVLIILKYL